MSGSPQFDDAINELRAVRAQGQELADAIYEYFAPAPPSEHFIVDLEKWEALTDHTTKKGA